VAEELVAVGRMPHEPGGSVRAAPANAMVGMNKQYYGRGPTAAKARILDDYVFVAMEGGLTCNEETLLDRMRRPLPLHSTHGGGGRRARSSSS
jgi:uncharacterized protein YbcI